MTAMLSSGYTGHGSPTPFNRPPKVEEYQIKCNRFTVIRFEIGKGIVIHYSLMVHFKDCGKWITAVKEAFGL